MNFPKIDFNLSKNPAESDQNGPTNLSNANRTYGTPLVGVSAIQIKFLWGCLATQVIQRRDDYGEERENFNRDWDDYKSGFGDPEMEFWLGNENIYMLTNAEDYSLRVELEDFEGNVR